MKKAWLAGVPWAVVIETNRLLCEPKGAFHGPTSDGHERTKAIWESQYLSEMPLIDAIQLCRKSHRMAPFCNFNGNTFVAIIRKVITDFDIPPEKSAVFRSLAGHVVAGIADQHEEQQLLDLIQSEFPADNE